ncbi:MAG: PEP-CTERM sorting domain-containing protein [Planctomycetota bacterium]|nr:PEP-CTERM sorting domain-containing protein [Planctomycetota bacterium]
MAETNVKDASHWGDEETWVYTGQIYFSTPTVSFAENIDDNTFLKIDGNIWINDGNWSNVSTSGARSVSIGWHDFELRVGNGGGGAGCTANNTWTATKGFGFDPQGRNTTNSADYVIPVDPGDTSFLRVQNYFVSTYDFSGTLSEAADSTTGFEIHLEENWRFNQATINANPGNTVTITSDDSAKLTLAGVVNGSFGNLLRLGKAPSGADPGEMGKEIIEFAEGGNGILPAGRSLTVQNGLLAIDTPNMKTPTAPGSVVNIEANSTLYLADNPAYGTWNIKTGAWVRTDHADRLTQPGATWNWQNGAWVILDGNLAWNSAGLPKNTGANVVVSQDQFSDGLKLGDGCVLATPRTEGWQINGGPIVPFDQTNNVVQSVRLATENDLNVNMNLDLTNGILRDGEGNPVLDDKGNFIPTRADLIVGYTPGTEPFLPRTGAGLGNTGGGTQLMEFAKEAQNGRVRLWGATNNIGNLNVKSGYLELANEDADTFNISGKITVEGTTRPLAYAASWPIGLGIPERVNNWVAMRAGTLGTGIDVERGARLTLWGRLTDSPATHVQEKISFLGTGAGAQSYFYYRTNATDGGAPNRVIFDDVNLYDGTNLLLERDNISDWDWRLSATQHGGMSQIFRFNPGDGRGDFSLQDVKGNGEIRLGAEGNDIWTHVWGKIGGDDPNEHITITKLRSWMRIMPGASMTDNATINSAGTQMGIPGASYSRLEIRAGPAPATPDPVLYPPVYPTPLAGGTILGGSPGIGDMWRSEVYVYVSDATSNTVPNAPFAGPTYVLGTKLVALPGDSVWGAVRDDGMGSYSMPDNNGGTVVFSNVHLMPGSRAVIGSWDNTWSVWDFFLEGTDANSDRMVIRHWNNWDYMRMRNVTGTQATPGTLTMDEDIRYWFTGQLTNANINYNADDALDLQPGFNLGGGKASLSNQWGWCDVRTDPGAGTLENFVGNPSGDWGRSWFVMLWGELASDTVGEAGWGKDTTINVDNGGGVRLFADRSASGAPRNINVLDSMIVIGNQGLNSDGANGRLRSDRQDPWSDVWGKAVFMNVHLMDNAIVDVTRADAEIEVRNLYLDGGAGTYMARDDWDTLGNVTGTQFFPSILNITGGARLFLNGTITNANINWNNSNCIELQPGFNLNGNTITRIGDSGWMDFGNGDVNRAPGRLPFDPGSGTINWAGGGDGNMYVYNGMNNYDSFGDNGWGAGLTINLGGGRRMNLLVQQAVNGGETNENRFEGRINIVDSAAGLDAILRSWNQGGGSGNPLAYFSNVHLYANSEVRLEDALLRADITLEDGDAMVSMDGNLWNPEIHVTASDTAKTLYINEVRQQDVNNFPTPSVRLAMTGMANAAFDNTGGGATRLEGLLSLGGNTLMIQRTSNGLNGDGRPYPIEMWATADDPGAGTILINGYWDGAQWLGGGFEVRRGANGDLAQSLTPATKVDIMNGRMLRSMVCFSNGGQLVNTVAADITIKADADPMNVDGVLSGRQADWGGGAVAGLVLYPNVTLEPYAGLEIRTDFGAPPYIQVGGTGGNGAIRLLGPAGLVNDSSETMIIVGDVTDEGNGYDFGLFGSQRFHITNNVSVANLAVYGKAAIEPSATLNLTGGIAVQTGGELMMNAAYPAGTMVLNDKSKLILNHEVFTPKLLMAYDSVEVDLNVNVAWTVNGSNQKVLIGVPGYSATLTLNRDDASIGAINTDGASILSPIAGTAATIAFRGGDKLLGLGDETQAILTDLAVGGTAVVIDRNLTVCSPNTYSRGTTITSGTTRACNASSLGTGPVVLSNAGTVLQLRAVDFSSGPITVNTDATLALYRNTSSPITFAGGTISAVRDAVASGALVDGNVAQFAVAAGKALIFTEPLEMTADRTWTIPSGTVVVAGDVTGDVGGAKNLVKLGAGTLRLGGGGNDILTLTLGGGGGGGGIVVVSGAAPQKVTIGQGSAYSVSRMDYPYTEVDMTASSGVLALGANNSLALTFLNSSMSLGAYADSEYNNIDPIAKGMVVLAGPVSVKGNIDIYGAAGITTDVSSALAVNVNPGGSIDLGTQPIPVNLYMQGGGVARTGDTLTVLDLATLFPSATSDYVLGGGGSDNTDVADGALVNAVANLHKVGTSQVTLLDPGGPSANTYGGGITQVDDGTLVVKDLASLAYTVNLSVGGGVLRLEKGGTFTGNVTLDNAASLFVASGETIVANGLTIGGPTARPSLTGGGTFDTSGTIVNAGLTDGAILDIMGGATLASKLGLTSEMRANMFKVREGSTLRFTAATPVARPTQNQAIGSMYPGSTLELAAGLGTGGTWYCIAGHPGIRLDVDQEEYDNLGQAAFSSETRPYRITIGAGTELDFYDVDINGNTLPDGNLMTPVLVGDCGNHRPVAHIEKAGGGEMWMYNTFNPASNDTRLLSWIVTGGSLLSMDDNALGATAGGWLASGKAAAIVQQHLEGITVKGGGTLGWRGAQGFLPASAYGGLPVGEGDGFNLGEFILEDNATLQSTDASLILGVQCMGQTYLAIPTIKSTGGVPNPTIRGDVNIRSGIAVDASVPGGLTDLTVGGSVKLTSDLPGAVGFNSVRNLTHTDGTTSVLTSLPLLQSTTVQSGTLEIGPAGTLAYGGNIDLTGQGNLHARPGTVNMPNTMITSTAPAPVWVPGLLEGRITGNWWNLNTPNPGGAIQLAPVMAQTNAKPPWGDDESWVYTGEFYQPTPSTVSFVEHIDDNTLLKIDGEVWITDTAWYAPTSSGSRYLSAGWHTFEARVGNGGGGAGAMFDLGNGNMMGFGYDSSGRGTTNPADYVKPVDPGDGSVFRTSTSGVVNGIVTVDAGATVNARGFQGVNLVDLKGIMSIGLDRSTSTTRGLRMAEDALGATAKLDITNGSLVIDYTGGTSPIADVRRWILQAYNGMAWDGNGITSSTAAANAITYGIGCIDNAAPDLLLRFGDGTTGPLFGNVTPVAVNLESVLVKLTYNGDVTLDGVVDDNDVTFMNLFYDAGASPNHTWWTGDIFLNDGLCDDNDITILNLTYGMGVGAPLGGVPVGAVPEPATLALVALGGLAALAGRRRGRK